MNSNNRSKRNIDKRNMNKAKIIKTIFGFISSTIVAFFIAIIVITVTGIFMGDDAKEFSSFYQLGSQGIAYNTILQWLTASFVMAGFGMLLHSEWVCRRLMAFWRYALNVISMIITVVVFSACFNWFPLDIAEAWIVFLICFVISFAISLKLVSIKIKSEGRLYDKLLEDYKSRLSEEDDISEGIDNQ